MPRKTNLGGRKPREVADLTEGLPVRKRRRDSYVVEDAQGRAVAEVLLRARAGVRVNLRHELPADAPERVRVAFQPTRSTGQFAQFTYVTPETARAARRALELAAREGNTDADAPLTRDTSRHETGGGRKRGMRKREHANA